MITIPPRGIEHRNREPGSAYGQRFTGDPGGPGPGRGRPGLRRPGPGDQPVDELRAGSRTAPTGRAGSTPGPTTRPPSTPSGCWPRWRAAPWRTAAPARCSARGWRRPPRCSSRCCPATTCWSPASCTGACASGWPNSRLTWGLDVEFTDTADLAAVAAAIRPGRTRLLWVETPANPMWEITDLAAVCDLAHAAGVRVAVDNTVATPVLTRPFEFGADLVVHSATKYLNGHGDVLAGAVLAARRDPFWERIRSWRRNAGAMPGPFEAWLLQRGMRTLFLRVHRASQTALADRHPLPRASGAVGGALSRAAGPSGPRDRGPADGRRVRRDAVHPAGRRRRARPRRAGRGPGVQAGHLAGRGGEPDRAPAQLRGAVLPGA